VLALLVLLIVWVVNSGDPDGSNEPSSGANAKKPATSITPGPSASGPAISDRPGGRDEADADATGDSAGDSGAGDGGPTAGDDSGSGDGGQAGAAGGGSGSSGGGIPVGVSLPGCTGGAVELTLRSVENSYAPEEKPRFEVTATNSSGTACQVDFGGGSAALTITSTAGEDEVWSSNDCPRDDGRVLLQVPAGGAASRTVEWDRRPSEPRCATPTGGAAGPGTYLVEAKAAGLKTARASFSLAKD
jgi:hypothetical protein